MKLSPRFRLTSAVAALAAMLLLPAAAGAQESARIHLMHGIPDVDVDVWVGGDAVFTDFAFGERQDLSALAGTTLDDVEVRLAGQDTVAIDLGDVDLPASGNYTIIAHYDSDMTPTATVFENDVSQIDAGEGRLTVRHTAAAPAVDVLADGSVAFANLSEPNETAADLPVGVISAEVVPTGASEPVVIGPADLSIESGSSLIVYAVGSLEDGSLTVLTESVTGLGTAPTQVATGNSPITQDGAPVILIALGLMGAVTVALLRNGQQAAERARR